MSALVPTLTLKGWLEDANEKGSQLMSWFMMSQATQSRTFYGNIASMSDLVVRFGKMPGAMCDNTKIQLEQLFRGYFDEVQAEVTELPMPGETEFNGRYQIKILVTAFNGRERINVMENAEIENSTFRRIMETVNNGGQ